MQEDLEKIREAKAVAEANIVPGVMNPHVSYYEVMLKQGYVVAEGMYQGKNMAILIHIRIGEILRSPHWRHSESASKASRR